MKKFYDKGKKRLVVVGESSTEKFWEKHWLDPIDFEQRVRAGADFGIIKKYTSIFLSPPAKIIDAGCGIGQNVYGLCQWGYDAYGIDFTGEVVKKTRQIFPDLKISTQDVRRPDFPNNFFDGYWSLGVVEHFRGGHGDIIKEAKRVIKKNGYLFVTVPWFSPLRQMKAWLGLYPKFDKKVDMGHFYEFILDSTQLVETIQIEGFKLVSKHPNDAVKGLKDEVSFLRPVLQKIYKGSSLFSRVLRGLLTMFFAPFAGHIILLVFKKYEDDL